MVIAVCILVSIIALILFLALIAPKTYHVKRTINIQKPLPEVFQYLKLVKNQDHWSPWKRKDPDMKQESFGIDGDIGFINKWKGNKAVGEGEQEITALIENEVINTELRFFKPWKSESDGYIKVDEMDANTTKVTWGFSGINKFPSNIFMLFFNMDKVVGKDFEEGLAALKVILEK